MTSVGKSRVATVDLEMLCACAERYRVSLIAAVLRWLSYTEKRAILVVSRDGFILWARSSEPAWRTGAFFKTSAGPIEVPATALPLGWIEPHRVYVGLFMPSATATLAIAALEAQLSEHLDAAAFIRFGEVEVTAAEVSAWSEAWALDQPSGPEQQAMAEMLLGGKTPVARRKGCALMLAAASNVSKASIDRIRATMAGAPSNFVPPVGLEPTQAAWRDVQVRQLFRLALEALFYWAASELKDAPRTTDGFV